MNNSVLKFYPMVVKNCSKCNCECTITDIHYGVVISSFNTFLCDNCIKLFLNKNQENDS